MPLIIYASSLTRFYGFDKLYMPHPQTENDRRTARRHIPFYILSSAKTRCSLRLFRMILPLISIGSNGCAGTARPKK